MLLDGADIFECDWLLGRLSAVSHSFPSFLFPLVHGLSVRHDLNRAPVILEAHPSAEALLVERTKGRLEGVIVCRSKQLPRKRTTGNRSEIPFHGLFFDNLSLVEIILLLIEGGPLQGSRVHRNRPAIAKLVQHRIVIKRPDPDSVAFRALQKHSCQTEQRVGSVSLLDLLDDLGKGALLWQKVHLNGRRFDLLKYLFIPSQIRLLTPK